MASATAPSTPEHSNRINKYNNNNDSNTTWRTAMNRSFTVPPKLAASTRAKPSADIGAADGIETLYVHPSAAVIKFTTASNSRPSSSSSGGGRSSFGARQGNTEEAVLIPWATTTERTMSAGPLEIYRVPGSVSFLHSGSLLHAILPRSQCWCVDGVSKFAFRVLQDTYYRIELPGETAEDLESVEALKTTLKKVLWYERTPCPFKRGFTVDLPVEEEISVKKNRRKSSGPAKKWKLDNRKSWRPEDWQERVGRDRSASSDVSSDEDSDEPGETEAAGANGLDVQEKIEETSEGSSDATSQSRQLRELMLTTPSKPKGLSAMRSVTAPPQLSLRSTPPSRARISAALGGTGLSKVTSQRENLTEASPDETSQNKASNSQMDALSTLRTFQPIPTDMPPSPPDSSAGTESADPLGTTFAMQHPTDDDEDPLAGLSFEERVQLLHAEAHGETFTPKRGTHTHQTTIPEVSSTYGASNSSSSSTISRPQLTARQSSKPSFPRSFSSSSTLSTHSNSTHRQQQSQQPNAALATALVRKTCAVFLGPPAHLVALMLRIAARFARGALDVDLGPGFANSSFVIKSPPGAVKRVPGSWNLGEDFEESDEDVWGNGVEGEDVEEDDFGVPLTSPVRVMKGRQDGSGDDRVKERGVGGVD